MTTTFFTSEIKTLLQPTTPFYVCKLKTKCWNLHFKDNEVKWSENFVIKIQLRRFTSVIKAKNVSWTLLMKREKEKCCKWRRKIKWIINWKFYTIKCFYLLHSFSFWRGKDCWFVSFSDISLLLKERSEKRKTGK